MHRQIVDEKRDEQLNIEQYITHAHKYHWEALVAKRRRETEQYNPHQCTQSDCRRLYAVNRH